MSTIPPVAQPYSTSPVLQQVSSTTFRSTNAPASLTNAPASLEHNKSLPFSLKVELENQITSLENLNRALQLDMDVITQKYQRNEQELEILTKNYDKLLERLETIVISSNSRLPFTSYTRPAPLNRNAYEDVTYWTQSEYNKDKNAVSGDTDALSTQKRGRGRPRRSTSSEEQILSYPFLQDEYGQPMDAQQIANANGVAQRCFQALDDLQPSRIPTTFTGLAQDCFEYIKIIIYNEFFKFQLCDVTAWKFKLWLQNVFNAWNNARKKKIKGSVSEPCPDSSLLDDPSLLTMDDDDFRSTSVEEKYDMAVIEKASALQDSTPSPMTDTPEPVAIALIDPFEPLTSSTSMMAVATADSSTSPEQDVPPSPVIDTTTPASFFTSTSSRSLLDNFISFSNPGVPPTPSTSSSALLSGPLPVLPPSGTLPPLSLLTLTKSPSTDQEDISLWGHAFVHVPMATTMTASVNPSQTSQANEPLQGILSNPQPVASGSRAKKKIVKPRAGALSSCNANDVHRNLMIEAFNRANLNGGDGNEFKEWKGKLTGMEIAEFDRQAQEQKKAANANGARPTKRRVGRLVGINDTHTEMTPLM
ncbi:hypothetical protein VKT23_014387 [Stygiomarasmius scandens]|uniref:Uncharacterized protein n=1 Tax=Marasmiellus scandens TaxID=2682957 RepID=A0ABR1J5C5_9AGAR